MTRAKKAASGKPSDRVTVKVKDWERFTREPSVANAYTTPSSNWIFRGQSQAKNGLCPSLLRAVTELDPEVSEDHLLENLRLFESAACEEFQTQAHLYLGPALWTTAPTEVHWWMHMQHFGAPTRLLDWSLSPFVAAYFACEKDLDTDGAVWALNITASNFSMPGKFAREMSPEDRDDVNDKFLEHYEEAATLHLQTDGGLRNERMTAQQGVFMLSTNPAKEHDSLLLELPKIKANPEMFRKIVIPKSRKRDFCRRLRSVNINARSLFPGLDGLGKSIAEMVRFDAFWSVGDVEPEG